MEATGLCPFSVYKSHTLLTLRLEVDHFFERGLKIQVRFAARTCIF
uniref:Uncharacterized protein n=1 Tax=Anguilla anguilla TaxID=7936 RepID=A0A0E9XQV3_ANGAN